MAVESCKSCQELQPSQQRELHLWHKKVKIAFERLHTDYCTKGGRDWLILVNEYTGFPYVYKMANLTATMLCKALRVRRNFMTAGVPKILKLAGQLSFTSAEFQRFASHWGIYLQTSSPHASHTNGWRRQQSRTSKGS